MAMVERREAARRAKDWPTADALREQITLSGWQVIDTPEGPKIVR
jgi:cysteinyl-tRNA synthetase